MNQTIYYARIDYEEEQPVITGVVRRRIIDGAEQDEAFTRNLRWEDTDYLRLYEIGHIEDDYQEISEEEALDFVIRIQDRELG